MKRLTIPVTAILFLALSAPALARWGAHNECATKTKPVDEHCYAKWDYTTGENSHVTGAQTEILTPMASIPGGTSEDFLSNEMWVASENQGIEGWIETGQLHEQEAGGESNMHPFVNEVSPAGIWHEQVSPGIISTFQQARYDLYQIWDRGENKVWKVYWGCCGEVAAYGGALPVHESEVEVGEEVGSEVKPAAQGASRVAISTENLPWETWPNATPESADSLCIGLNAFYSELGNGSWMSAAIGEKRECNNYEGKVGAAGIKAAVEGEAPVNEGPRVTNYTQPAGAEISIQRAEEIALGRAVGADPALRGTKKSKAKVYRGTYAQTVAVEAGEHATEAETGSDAELAEWDTSTAYLVVIRAPKGTMLEPNLPTRAKHPGPAGKIMVETVDAHTGFIEGVYVAEKAPKASRMKELEKV